MSFVVFAAFILVMSCFLTYLITFTETDKLWRNRVDTMLSTEATEASESMNELADAVSERCIYDVDAKSVSDGVRYGYISALGDKYSMYMDAEQYKSYLDFARQSSNVGIGVSTVYDASVDGVKIINVYKGSPAERAGVVPGDIITALDGVAAKTLGYYGVMCKLGTGGEDTEISVSVKKADGTEKQFGIERNTVEVKNIKGTNLGNRIGLITICGFAVNDAELFKSEMERLLKIGCEKFVLDVRNNAGGDIDEVASALDFLLGEGTLFTVSQKSGVTDTRVSKHKSVPYPMAVLVNERTLCGAEVFAGVLQLFDAAELVGDRTGGKATVQSLTELSDGSAVSLSTSKYIIGTGFDFDITGLTPDIPAELPLSDSMHFTTLSSKEDAQLLAATEYLKGREAVYSKD